MADRHARVEAEAGEVGAVARVAVGDPQVADQGQAEAPAHRVSVHRGDRRHGQVEDLEEGLVGAVQPLVVGEISPAARLRGGGAAEVGARAEARAPARHHDGAQLGVRAGTRDAFAERGHDLGGHAVAVLGAVERERSDPALDLV